MAVNNKRKPIKNFEASMAPAKGGKRSVTCNDAKKGSTITEYFKAEKPRSKAKNPLTEEQKLKRFKEGVPRRSLKYS